MHNKYIVITNKDTSFKYYPSKKEAISWANYIVRKTKCICGIYKEEARILPAKGGRTRKIKSEPQEHWTDKIFTEETSNIVGYIVLVLGGALFVYHILMYLAKLGGLL